jgi:hypothetical protein
MKSLLILASLVNFSSLDQPETPKLSLPPVEQKMAVMCFKTGEQTSGMNKICYYNCLGSEAAITIGAVQLCPLSIDR